MPDDSFDDFPRRHVRAIDGARRLKTHANDDTRHLDVEITNPQDGDVLIYDGDAGVWKNEQPPWEESPPT